MKKIEALKLAKEEIEKLKKFFEWREQEMKKELKNSKDVCSCIKSVRNPSWASMVHTIQFHVCEEHAKKFGIPIGPYWKKDLVEDVEERAENIMERKKRWSDTDYGMRKSMKELRELKESTFGTDWTNRVGNQGGGRVIIAFEIENDEAATQLPPIFYPKHFNGSGEGAVELK